MVEHAASPVPLPAKTSLLERAKQLMQRGRPAWEPGVGPLLVSGGIRLNSAWQ